MPRMLSFPSWVTLAPSASTANVTSINSPVFRACPAREPAVGVELGTLARIGDGSREARLGLRASRFMSVGLRGLSHTALEVDGEQQGRPAKKERQQREHREPAGAEDLRRESEEQRAGDTRELLAHR